MDSVGVWIRPATEADLPAMEWDGAYRHFRRLYQAAFAEAKLGRRMILVAEHRGKVVGQIIMQFGSDLTCLQDGPATGFLYSFRVRPPNRNRGLGTRLILEAEAHLRRRAYRWAAIAAAKNNPRARALYERLGYAVVGEDPGVWSFVDDRGALQHVTEPADVLEKVLTEDAA